MFHKTERVLFSGKMAFKWVKNQTFFQTGQFSNRLELVCPKIWILFQCFNAKHWNTLKCEEFLHFKNKSMNAPLNVPFNEDDSGLVLKKNKNKTTLEKIRETNENRPSRRLFAAFFVPFFVSTLNILWKKIGSKTKRERKEIQNRSQWKKNILINNHPFHQTNPTSPSRWKTKQKGVKTKEKRRFLFRSREHQNIQRDRKQMQRLVKKIRLITESWWIKTIKSVDAIQLGWTDKTRHVFFLTG